jgi:transposase
MLDNLRLHHSKVVIERCRKYNIEIIFNAPYSSEYNPVERLWCYAKNHFKKHMISVTDYKN